MEKKLKKEIRELHKKVDILEEMLVAILDVVSSLYTMNKAEVLAFQKLTEGLLPDAEITEDEIATIYEQHPSCPSPKVDEYHEEDELLHEIETRKRPVRLSENEKKALVRDSKKLTRPELQEKYNVSERTVRRALGGKG